MAAQWFDVRYVLDAIFHYDFVVTEEESSEEGEDIYAYLGELHVVVN